MIERGTLKWRFRAGLRGLAASLVAPGNLLKEHPREFSPASLAALHEKHGVKKMGTKR